MKGKLLARNRPCAHAAPRAARLPTADHAHRSPPSCRAVQRVRRPVRPRRARLGAALARRRGSAVFRCNLPSPCTFGDAPHKLQQPRAITGRISPPSRLQGQTESVPPARLGSATPNSSTWQPAALSTDPGSTICSAHVHILVNLVQNHTDPKLLSGSGKIRDSGVDLQLKNPLRLFSRFLTRNILVEFVP